MIELNRDTHIYAPNLPSVTQILTEAGIINPTWYTEESMERGTIVHLACEYLDQGDLDESTIDPSIIGYIESYKKFKAHLGYTPEWIEVPQKDPTGVYAGTPDRIIITRPRSLDDLKTGPYQHWHRLQSAAYVNTLNDSFSYERRGIYLQKDGSMAKVKVFLKSEYMSDLSAFLSCLNIINWKRRFNGGTA